MPLPQPTIQYDPQQPDLLGKVGRVMSLRNLAQAGRLQQEQLTAADQENQARALQLKSTQATMRAFTDAQGDPDRTVALAAQYGADPQHVIALKNSFIAQQENIAKLTKEQQDNAIKQADMIGNAAQAVLALPSEQRRAGIVKALGDFTAQQAIPIQQAQQLLSTVPDDPAGQEQWLRFHAAAAMSAKDQIAQLRQQQVDAETARHDRAMEVRKPVPGVDVPYSPEVMAQKKALKTTLNMTTGSDISNVADAIAAGEAPPDIREYSFRDRTALASQLKQKGFNLAQATTDWKATQKYVGTLNGSQQVRLRQAITALPDLADKIEGLYDEWKQVGAQSGVRIFNKASLATAKQLPGRAGAVAQALDAQIADAVSDLAVVYMGGNSPTDHGLSLAQKNLSADWNEATFKEGLRQLRANARIRYNSIQNAGVMGASEGNQYAPKPQVQPASQAGGSSDPFAAFGGKAR